MKVEKKVKKNCKWCRREFEGKFHDICCGDKKCLEIQSIFPEALLNDVMSEEISSICKIFLKQRYTHHWNVDGRWELNGKCSSDWTPELIERVHIKFYQLFGDYKCFECGKLEINNIDERGKRKRLSIHHVNYDVSMGCDNPNLKLVPLCNSCHMKTNGVRNYWKRYFTKKLENIPGFDGTCWISKEEYKIYRRSVSTLVRKSTFS